MLRRGRKLVARVVSVTAGRARLAVAGTELDVAAEAALVPGATVRLEVHAVAEGRIALRLLREEPAGGDGWRAQEAVHWPAMDAPQPVTLEGRTVRLEPLAERHREDLRAAVDDDRAAFTVYGPVFVEGGLDGWLAAALAEFAAGTRLPFAVVDRATERACGSSSYLDIAPADRRIEIGHTWYGGAWQGTTVNPEAKLLLLGHAFDTLGAFRVTLKTDARNERSRRGIEGVGGVFEGVLRRHSRTADGTEGQRDVAMFSILDHEWPAVRARLAARVG